MLTHASAVSKTAAIVFLSLALSASMALAASGGGSSSGSSNPSPPPIDCKKEKGAGWIYSETQKKCVKHQALNDGELYTEGRALALAGSYDSALDALQAVKNKDSMTLTMTGYATRKLGNYDQGVAYYQQALAIDANNINTHEYLGEAYAEKGHPDLAQAELVKVAALGGIASEQYRDLAAAISGTPDND
jgi:tetratricopeptide (TPR) repeat protein